MLRNRCVSRSISRSAPTTPMDSTTAPARIPMIATTTSSSSSEKPRCVARVIRDLGSDLVEIPVTDVGIEAFAAFLTVAAERENVELAVLPGVRVLIGVIPRVDRRLLQLRLPVRSRVLARIRDEGLQALFGARIAEV